MFHQEVMNHKSEYMPPAVKDDEDAQPPVRLHRSGGGGVRQDIIDDDSAFDEIQRMLERITGNKSKK